MHGDSQTTFTTRSTRDRGSRLAPVLTVAIALGATVAPEAAEARGTAGEPCGYSATVAPGGIGGAIVTLQWGVVWGNTCEWSGLTATVSERRIDLIVLQESDFCFATPMNYCSEVTLGDAVPAGTYEVHVSVVAAWEGGRGQLLHDFGMIDTLIVPGTTPCGTIVEGNFNDGKLGDLEFFDQTIAGVGAYEAVDGTARLFTTADVAALAEGVALVVSDSYENADLYADGTIELAFRAASSRPFVQIAARLTDLGEASAGYLLSAVSAPFNFLIVERGNGDGTGTTLAQFPFAVVPDVDYRMRATFVGDLIELTLWLADDPEPAPQISVIDATPVLDGGITGVGASRSQGAGVVDVTFSELTFTLPDECEEPILGDLNGDGVVDGADLGILLNGWGGAGAADLNGDGIIDGADLGILLNNWG